MFYLFSLKNKCVTILRILSTSACLDHLINFPPLFVKTSFLSFGAMPPTGHHPFAFIQSAAAQWEREYRACEARRQDVYQKMSQARMSLMHDE